MRRRHRFTVALGLIVPACSQPAAPARRDTVSASPQADEVGSDTPPGSEPTSTSPAVTAPPVAVTAGPSTTIVLPTVPRTTTTIVAAPEDDDDEAWWTSQPGSASVSWYGDEAGSHTANGDRYDPNGLTFAHRSLPFGTRVRFCAGGRCVVATCTDRGPAAWTGRDFDLSRGTFAALAPLSAGVARVSWAVVS